MNQEHPMRRRLLLALALGIATILPTRADMISFHSTAVGAAPQNFEFARTGSGAAGQWTIVADASGDGGHALEQRNTDKTDYRFPLAIYQPIRAGNVDATVRFKAVAGAVDRAAGIAVRLQDADNYYVVRANALEDNVRFYHVVKGRRTELKSANVKVAANVWHTLALEVQDDRFTIVFDGKPLYSVTDTTIPQAGKVALWTKSDSVTRFDRFEITAKD
jgi:hypothetical protein